MPVRLTKPVVQEMGSTIHLETGNGKTIATWLPEATFQRDMVSSPDGRFVLTTTGTHRLSIYRTDGSQFPFLNLVRANGEWVCWTTEGYYAASPGGEKQIGWAVHNGPNELAAFHPAEKFARRCGFITVFVILLPYRQQYYAIFESTQPT